MLIEPVTSFVTLIYYYIFYCILARLCEAAGAGCLSENIFETGDCDAFEENGWDGAHIVAGLNVTRPATHCRWLRGSSGRRIQSAARLCGGNP